MQELGRSPDKRRIALQQMMSLWSALDMRRRVIVLVATLAMFAAVLGLSRMAATPSMALLYSGLESRAAGDVIKSLDTKAVKYEVRGDSIWVDATQRDQLRMTLATEGLPANGGAGYELLDGISGFGTTSQMFDATYWRAKEGELARTIATSPTIRAARVYISAAQSQPFRHDVKPTASVMVTTSQGRLTVGEAKAIRYLVASAVAGLQPTDVAVIDSVGGLVLSGDETAPGASTGADRAAILKRNVTNLLEARVGPGKAVVAVNIETVTDRESIVQKTFDPAGRVAISTDTQDQSTSSTDKGSGAVTVASNLPNGAANNNGSTSQSQNKDTRERTNYEVSTTQRELVKTPGAISKLSVAVLLDGLRSVDANGKELWKPRPAEEISALHDLVASAVGYDQKRGDVITIKSMAFEPITPLGTSSETSFLARMNIDAMSAIQLAVLAIVALVMGVFVIRPILTSSRARALPALGRPADAPTSDHIARVLTGEIDDGTYIPDRMSVVSKDEQDSAIGQVADSDPVLRLRRLIADRQGETIEILRNWVEDREETTT
jgi:flagellar M-ring protein FliF